MTALLPELHPCKMLVFDRLVARELCVKNRKNDMRRTADGSDVVEVKAKLPSDDDAGMPRLREGSRVHVAGAQQPYLLT